MSNSADHTKDTSTPQSATARTPRFSTGVSLEPEVTRYLDDLSRRMRMNRSWVLNTIVHEYARFIEQKNLVPLASSQEIIRL